MRKEPCLRNAADIVAASLLAVAGGLLLLNILRPRQRTAVQAFGERPPVQEAPIDLREEPKLQPVPEPELPAFLSGPPRRRHAPWIYLASSGVIHSILAVYLFLAQGSVRIQPSPAPKYRLQILHLRRPTHSEEEAGKAAYAQRGSAGRGSGGRSIVSRPTELQQAAMRASVPSPQTLVVAGAPAALKLNQAIPLPELAAWWMVPLPSQKLSAPSPTVAHGEPLPDFVPTAGINIVSLPEPPHRAPAVVTIPEVNQSAASQSASGAVSVSAPALPSATTGNSSPANATAAASSASGGGSMARIDLPPDGRVASAILGQSAHLPGRVVSTIYLKVGLRRTWILEYWTAGNAGGVDAPWAYHMLRPEVAIPGDAEAVIVRATLNVEGRLEHFAMLAPDPWPQQDALFRVLGEWRFRAAARNGQAIRADVLLVIPRQPEE